MDLKKLTRPTLILDVEKCKSNIKRMTDKARKRQLKLRPHFKTHQSAQIAEWIRDAGVTTCTVSSVKMAAYFANHGWDDILIAFPVNVLEVEKINELAHKLKLQVLVYDVESLKILEQKIDASIGVKIELDLGSKRSGVKVNQHEEIAGLLKQIESSSNFKFTGFYSHPGHTYTVRSKEEVLAIYDDIIGQLETLKSQYAQVPGFSITIGDTPGCTISDKFDPIEEISPGNFVFYDAMQVNIGTCNYEDIAVVMACPVVGKSLERNELLIHGGAVHFSKEALQDSDGVTHFGKLARQTDTGWEGQIPGTYLKSISQEHGLIHCPDDIINKTHIGDMVYIYPVHSCLTADLMKSYITTGGKVMDGESAFMP